MKKRNTKAAARIRYFAFVISGIFAVIGIIADLFGVASGISEHKETIFGVCGAILSFLADYWKWALFATVILLITVLISRWRDKKQRDERRTRLLSWFDAEQRNTNYSGGADYLYELKHFFEQKDVDFSWWVVTGVAGIGKTRLVLEALRDDDLVNVDIQWLKEFNDYREEALEKRVDAILGSRNFRNIIIAEDAQLYMDNIGALINHIAGKSVDEIGDHKIRLLLLIRMGEDEDLTDRYRQLESKSYQARVERTRFVEFGSELTIDKYTEADIAEVVKSYAISTKKKRSQKALTDEQMNNLQKKAIEALKAERVDPYHLRPLFSMFITDALINGKAPMSWSRKDILEYAISEREDDLMRWEAFDLQKNENRIVYDKIKGIICLSIIRNGIAISELEEIKESIEKELRLSGITLQDFLREMQLLGYDGIIKQHMPDILSEYYVLHNLVIKPDESIVNWVIEKLCMSLEGTDACKEKIRQDFDYLFDEIEDQIDDFYYAFFEKCSAELAFSVILKLCYTGYLRRSNAIILHEAIGNQIRNNSNLVTIADILYRVSCDAPEMEEKHVCLSELERLAKENAGETEIVHKYCNGLVNMLWNDPRIEEKHECLSELEHLAKKNAGETEIVNKYCMGLVDLLIFEPEIEEKRVHLSELKRLMEENAGETEIVHKYCIGLFNMLNHEPGMEEKRVHLSELKRLMEENAGEAEIVHKYCMGLVNMLTHETGMEEKHVHLSELKRLSEENAGEAEIVLSYCEGLFNMLNHEPGMEEKCECLVELKRLSEENAGEADVAHEYCKGLYNMLCFNPGMEEKRECLSELKRLSEENARQVEIVLLYCCGLYNMLNYESGMEEKRVHLSELKCLANENAGEAKIVLLYCEGLFNMLWYEPGMEEKRECLSELKRLSEENAGQADIVLYYCEGLFNMRNFDDEQYEKYILELYGLLSNITFAQYVAQKEPDIITYTRRELLEYEFG